MTSMELFQLLGQAREQHILEAQQLRSGGPLRRTPKRALLLAAAIAMALLLVGCAVAVLLNLEGMILSQKQQTDQRTGETGRWTVLSLQGYAGSPGYQAAREWYDFLQTDTSRYDDHRCSRKAAYYCYSQDRHDQIDEICQTYGLELLGKYYDTSMEDLQQLLGIGSVFDLTVPAERKVDYSYFYLGGTFQMEGKMTLPEIWTNPVRYQLRCSMKNTFDSVCLNIGDVEAYTQWNYTLSEGTPVLLALSGTKALILADRENFFLTVNILNPTLGDRTMDQAALEAVAECFDLSFDPQPVSDEAAKEAQDRWRAEVYLQGDEERGRTFADAVRSHLETDRDPERLGFLFHDIDGDGEQELIIGCDGYITAIYKEVEGTVQRQRDAYGYHWLCEDGYLVSVLELRDSITITNLRQKESASQSYRRGRQDAQWSKMLPQWGKTEPISGEDLLDAITAHKRLVLDLLPLTQYPLDAPLDRYRGEGNMNNRPEESYSEKIRMKLTSPEEQWDRWKYAFLDVDGNGQEELLWQEDDRRYLFTMDRGVTKTLIGNNQGITFCEDSVAEVLKTYGPENKCYFYYRLDGAERILLDYLRYDVDRNPEAPWFHSPDGSCQDATLRGISAEEAQSIRDKYPHLPQQPEMLPITEYPG